MNNNIKSFLVGAIVTIVLVGGVALAVVAALKMNTTNPVAPTVPQIKPRAEGPAITPACSLTFTIAKFTCDKIELSPDNQTITSNGESRTLTAKTSNSVGSLSYAWTKTSTGADTGTYSSVSTNPVVWTAPTNLTTGTQNWTFRVTITDSTGTSSNCEIGVNYSKNAPKVCNDPCQKNEECSGGLICAGGNCRNSACITEPSCVCQPPKPPTPTCNSVCATSADCPSNLACTNGRCRNAACPNSSSCICPVPTCNSVCSTSSDCPSNLGCVNGRCRNAACPEMVGCVCPTPTHKECRGRSCVTVEGPASSASASLCTSDASCAPPAAPPPIPKSGNELLTAGMIIVGAVLIIAGLLVVL